MTSTGAAPVGTSIGPHVLVVGGLNLDLICDVDRLPHPGETVNGGALRRSPGGKGANQAVALARLGISTAMVGCIGDDDAGTTLLSSLTAQGVDVSGVRRVDAPTGIAMIVVDGAGENQIVVAPGANDQVTAGHVDIAAADAVLCQLEIPMSTLIDVASRTRGMFCLNAAPAAPLPSVLVQRADLVIVNEHEYRAIGVLDTAPMVAITLGAEGAVLLERGREVARATAPVVDAVDTVGAGDAFCAALVAGLVTGMPAQDALGRACTAGAIAVTRYGAQPSLPDLAELSAWGGNVCS